MWLFDSLEAGSLECFDPRRIEIAARSEHTGDCQHSVVSILITHQEWMLADHECDPMKSWPASDAAARQECQISCCAFRNQKHFISFAAPEPFIILQAWLLHDAFLASRKQGPHSWPSMYPFQCSQFTHGWPDKNLSSDVRSLIEHSRNGSFTSI